MLITTQLIVAATALASAVSANSVTFHNRGKVPQTVVFSAGCVMQNGQRRCHPSLGRIQVQPGCQVKQIFTHGWSGMWRSFFIGRDTGRGMQGEITFNGWNDYTWYDVDAELNPNDHSGVHMIYPAGSRQPVAGCDYLPGCPYMYWKHDDNHATKSSTEKDLICIIGPPGQ